MIFDNPLPYLYFAFLAASCGYAIYRGSRTEYWGAAIVISASIASTVALVVFETSWTGFDTGIFYIDLMVLLALIHVSLASDRFWPLWATGFHLVTVLIHIATMVAPDLTPWALATGSAFWAYPVLIALVIGAHEHALPSKSKRLRSG